MELKPYMSPEEKRWLDEILLNNIKQNLTDLQELLERMNGHWIYEDGLYRFYYQSYKVFRLQEHTQEIIAALKGIAPKNRGFSEYFQAVIKAGTGRAFTAETNGRWIEDTAPVVNAFMHARYFLEMAIKYASLESPPQPMPSGWAALTCLYDFR